MPQAGYNWLQFFGDLQKDAGKPIIDWYKQAQDSSLNPVNLRGIDEEHQGIFRYIIGGLIKSGYTASQIKGVMVYLKEFYSVQPQSKKDDEFFFISILIHMHEKYIWTIDLNIDDLSKITGVKDNLGNVDTLAVLKSFMSDFFDHFKPADLAQLRFTDYFVYGLDSDPKYQYQKVALLQDTYNCENNGTDVSKRASKGIEQVSAGGLANRKCDAVTNIDSPLNFLKNLTASLSSDSRNALDSSLERYEENPALNDKLMTYMYNHEIMYLNIIIVMIEHLRTYNEYYETAITEKLVAIVRWLSSYPFKNLNKKGAMIHDGFFSDFGNYYLNLCNFNTTAAPSKKDEFSIREKCNMLYIFFIKLRTVRLEKINGFENINDFCNRLDNSDYGDLPWNNGIINFRSDDFGLLSKHIRTINYRNDISFKGGFNVAGVPIGFEFWKSIDNFDYERKTRDYPVAYFLGILNSDCADTQLSAESFIATLKHCLGDVLYTELSKSAPQTFKSLNDEVNMYRNGICLELIDVPERSKKEGDFTNVEDFKLYKMCNELLHLHSFTGNLMFVEKTEKIKTIKENLYSLVDVWDPTVTIEGDLRFTIENINDVKRCFGLAYESSDNFIVKLYNSIEYIYNNMIPLIISTNTTSNFFVRINTLRDILNKIYELSIVKINNVTVEFETAKGEIKWFYVKRPTGKEGPEDYPSGEPPYYLAHFVEHVFNFLDTLNAYVQIESTHDEDSLSLVERIELIVDCPLIGYKNIVKKLFAIDPNNLDNTLENLKILNMDIRRAGSAANQIPAHRVFQKYLKIDKAEVPPFPKKRFDGSDISGDPATDVIFDNDLADKFPAKVPETVQEMVSRLIRYHTAMEEQMKPATYTHMEQYSAPDSMFIVPNFVKNENTRWYIQNKYIMKYLYAICVGLGKKMDNFFWILYGNDKKPSKFRTWWQTKYTSCFDPDKISCVKQVLSRCIDAPCFQMKAGTKYYEDLYTQVSAATGNNMTDYVKHKELYKLYHNNEDQAKMLNYFITTMCNFIDIINIIGTNLHTPELFGDQIITRLKYEIDTYFMRSDKAAAAAAEGASQYCDAYDLAYDTTENFGDDSPEKDYIINEGEDNSFIWIIEEAAKAKAKAEEAAAPAEEAAAEEEAPKNN